MTDEAAQRIRLMRYELYSRAIDGLLGERGQEALPPLVAETDGCRRAAEAIELAEFHVAFRFPKRGIEHFVRQLGRCSDCQRASCVADLLSSSPAGGSTSSGASAYHPRHIPSLPPK
jgi:hypothetical protein